MDQRKTSKSGVRRLSAIAAMALMVSGCSTVVQNRVESGLVDAGVPAGIASCMAPIWEEDLSISQIRSISRFASEIKEQRQTLTVPRLIDQVREWNDPEALAVVTTSAARCAFR
ncbi:hypothetical protein [Altericroceibacterium xinjiangense]|uniref:hypothetical protein n=1 Tax=Altericroceibacterium xinjiangense TaxID=762261 RepID=UPI000F7DE415|nr:hypothetical protein [Altericroceibacterium xinjiangense]